MLVIITLALAGCSAPGETPRGETAVAGPCVIPHLNATREVQAGQLIHVEASLVNCGGTPIEFWSVGCRAPPGLALRLRHGDLDLQLFSTSPSALPTAGAGFVGPCGPPQLAPERIILPGESLVARWEWNGSIERVYHYWTPVESPSPGYSIVGVSEILPPQVGGHELTLSFWDRNSSITWSRTVDVWIHGEDEYESGDGMTSWRDDPGAVENGDSPLPRERPAIVALAANGTLRTRWPERDAELLGLDERGDHYDARYRLHLRGLGETFEITIPVSADGHPLRGAVAGLPDCREAPPECEFGVLARDAAALAGADDDDPRLVWHAAGARGTYAWAVGDVLVDANDGRRIED